jgi:hypothetical protein
MRLVKKGMKMSANLRKSIKNKMPFLKMVLDIKIVK